MQYMTRDFYRNLYSSQGTLNMEQVLCHVPRKVTDEMNAFLCRPFTEKEVKEALFQMSPLKAPGPDGYPAHFSRGIGIYVGKILPGQCFQCSTGMSY